MADTYGVTPAEIAAELPGLFPGGFTANTTPTLAQVTSFITASDLWVAVAVQDAAGVAPSGSDRLAPVIKEVIKARVTARVLRIVYTGNVPGDVEAAAKPYEDLARETLSSITSLQTQAAGVGDPPNRVTTSSALPVRDLVICDEDLQIASRGRF